MNPFLYQISHPWHWLNYGQNGIVLAAGLSLFVSAFTVYVLLKTLHAVRQQAVAADRQAEAAEEQAKAARAGSLLARAQLQEATRERRLAKQRRLMDRAVLEVLNSDKTWSGPRPMLGGGGTLVKADELAEFLKTPESRVNASLRRLEERDRVTSHDGTLDDPAPWWSLVP